MRKKTTQKFSKPDSCNILLIFFVRLWFMYCMYAVAAFCELTNNTLAHNYCLKGFCGLVFPDLRDAEFNKLLGLVILNARQMLKRRG